LAVGAYLLLPTDSDPPPARGPAISTATTMRWATIDANPVPVSPTHGPRHTQAGRATGFSHDALGAALAAVNIGARLSSTATLAVSQATTREQCFGDVKGEITQIRHSAHTTPPPSTAPREFWYKASGGDPTGDLVKISTVIEIRQRSHNAPGRR